MNQSIYSVHNSFYDVFKTDCGDSAVQKMPNWRKMYRKNETGGKKGEEERAAIQYTISLEAIVIIIVWQ